jgi:hypothetical protein
VTAGALRLHSSQVDRLDRAIALLPALDEWVLSPSGLRLQVGSMVLRTSDETTTGRASRASLAAFVLEARAALPALLAIARGSAVERVEDRGPRCAICGCTASSPCAGGCLPVGSAAAAIRFCSRCVSTGRRPAR